MRRTPLAALASAVLLGAPTGAGPAAAPAPDRDYLVWVVSEGVDQLALIRFGPKGARVDRQVYVGQRRGEIDGPHGVAVAPDGRHLFISTAHGTPFGHLLEFSTSGDSLLGSAELGKFPATLQITPDGLYAYVVNFNLYGDMVPSSVSVVYTDKMVEVARIPTCTMPHGSRINPQGTRQYSACMMDDLAVEIDIRGMKVARHFMLAKGKEAGMEGAPASGMPHGAVTCSPTWAQPSADGSRLYVACNKSSEIVEIDVASWRMLRRIPAGEGVYNLAVSHDGRLLVATNKRGQSASIFDLASGKELARIPTKRKVVHGVVVSPDDRYAFVSVEGIGSEPGTVEVIDLIAHAGVASVDVGQQAGGIDFWKIESPQ